MHRSCYPERVTVHARTRTFVHCLSDHVCHCPVCDNTDAGKRTLRQTTSEVNNKTMGKNIRDAMISTPRMVTDRHVVTRVVVKGRKTALWWESWRRPMLPQ